MQLLKTETLRRRVERTKTRRGDAYIDVAYHAKVAPMTVWRFVNGVTSTPTFLTKWGLSNYVETFENSKTERRRPDPRAV